MVHDHEEVLPTDGSTTFPMWDANACYLSAIAGPKATVGLFRMFRIADFCIARDFNLSRAE